MTFLGAFWLTDFSVSATAQRNSRLVWEVRDALRAFRPERAMVPWNHSREVTPQELAKTGKLSRSARIWLKDASITIGPFDPSNMIIAIPWERQTYGWQFNSVSAAVTLNFPNGTHFSFNYVLSQSPVP
jgi:hypothetical protein